MMISEINGFGCKGLDMVLKEIVIHVYSGFLAVCRE
jgi:hypothetical protein